MICRLVYFWTASARRAKIILGWIFGWPLGDFSDFIIIDMDMSIFLHSF